MHDVVEDTQITLSDLRIRGFNYDVVEAVDAITKGDGEVYFEYLYRVKKNDIAKNVKWRKNSCRRTYNGFACTNLLFRSDAFCTESGLREVSPDTYEGLRSRAAAKDTRCRNFRQLHGFLQSKHVMQKQFLQTLWLLLYGYLQLHQTMQKHFLQTSHLSANCLTQTLPKN